MESSLRFKYSVGEGGIYDHHPIILQWKSGMEAPPTPLKISHVWLEEEYFKEMVNLNMEKVRPCGYCLTI
jgi:hypothetical protein